MKHTYGKFVKEFKNKKFEYEYYLPEKINKPINIKNIRIFVLLEQASKLIGELDSKAKQYMNINLFVNYSIQQEAVSSTKIEGTRTNIDDIYLSENLQQMEKNDDLEETKNYIQALNNGIDSLDRLPLSSRLINSLHSTVLQNVRGQYKNPGKFRTSQNWIGGASIQSANFIPPHPDHISDLMKDWEEFWHNEELNIPILIKVAIAHYQFETIHPYLDGNGRVGRLLIQMGLIEKKMINSPILLVSKFFENNRQEYYDSLDRVRYKNEIDQWILFFLDGVINIAQEAIEKIGEIQKLKTEIESQLVTKFKKRTNNAKSLLELLFQTPIISRTFIVKQLDIEYNVAYSLLDQFIELGIVKYFGIRSKTKLYIFADYYNLIN